MKKNIASSKSYILLIMGIFLLCSILALADEVKPGSSNSIRPYITVKVNNLDIFNNDIISENLRVSATVSSANELDPKKIRLFVDDNEIIPPELKLNARSPNIIQLDYSSPVDKDLTPGEHKIRIYTADNAGYSEVWERKGLLVFGGEPRIVEKVNIEPFPFVWNPREHIAIIYTLTKDVRISIYVYDAWGYLVWRSTFNEGQMGGKAGYNQVTWRGVDAKGNKVKDGYYPFRIIAITTG